MLSVSWKRSAAVLALAVMCSSAQAAFVEVDDFEGLTVDAAIHGQNGWVSQDALLVASPITIAADPANALNSVLKVPSASAPSAYHALGPITNGSSSATLFARFRYESGAMDVSWGTSDSATPTPSGQTVFTDFETQLVNTGSTLSVRSGGGAQPAESITVSTWYNVWMVINNSSDTYEVWMQGDTLLVPTKLDNNNSPNNDVFGFRNGAAANDLVSFMIRGGGGNSSIFYLDDIYLDLSGANFTNPTGAVPEPASLALLGLGSIGILSRRRQKR